VGLKINIMYLTNIPELNTTLGFPKVLAVRREIIHIKHIFTEIFVRKSVNIEKLLSEVGWSLFRYMEFMTNRIRRVHHFSREYNQDLNTVVKHNRDKFFPTIDLYQGLKVAIVLDFDGVITKNSFEELYQLCTKRSRSNQLEIIVCTANPTIDDWWFINRQYTLPDKIYANKGKIAKMKRLAQISTKYDYVFYVDNETMYLDWAWILGIQTYHYINNQIKYYTLKTK